MDTNEVVDWFHNAQSSLDWPKPWEIYKLLHPLTVFVKTLPKNSTLLDFGAGTGGLLGIINWPAIPRKDLRFWAYSLEYVKKFDDYVDYVIGNFEIQKPVFSIEKFDTIVCSHVIEHLSSSQEFCIWANSVLNPPGYLYIEWPSEFSAVQPRRSELLKRGVNITISNFYDDNTHKNIPQREEVIQQLISSGFNILMSGYIENTYVEDDLMAYGRIMNDQNLRTMAFWSRTRWCQYIIAKKL